MLLLFPPCFRENIVATCKIGSFLCSLDNLPQKKRNCLQDQCLNSFDWQCINLYPEFLRAFRAHTLAFQRALLNFQGLRTRGPFLFETLEKCIDKNPNCNSSER